MTTEGASLADAESVKEAGRREAGAGVHRALSPAPAYLTPIITLYFRAIIMPVLHQGLRLSYVTTCPRSHRKQQCWHLNPGVTAQARNFSTASNSVTTTCQKWPIKLECQKGRLCGEGSREQQVELKKEASEKHSNWRAARQKRRERCSALPQKAELGPIPGNYSKTNFQQLDE